MVPVLLELVGGTADAEGEATAASPDALASSKEAEEDGLPGWDKSATAVDLVENTATLEAVLADLNAAKLVIIGGDVTGALEVDFVTAMEDEGGTWRADVLDTKATAALHPPVRSQRWSHFTFRTELTKRLGRRRTRWLARRTLRQDRWHLCRLQSPAGRH